MSCSGDLYTININHDNNELNYRIIDGQANSNLERKCSELGWPNPLSSQSMKDFMETLMQSDQCFTNPSQNIRTFPFQDNECILSRSCQNSQHNIEYTCQHINYANTDNTDLVAHSYANPIQISSNYTIDNLLGPSQSDYTTPSGYIRCKQGYVPKNIGPNPTTLGGGGWVNEQNGLWWVYDTSTNQPSRHDWTGECVPDKCEDRIIPDSNHAYDPLHSSHDDDPIKVKCNDGYMFNHDLLHQGGYVKCDYSLKKSGDNLWDKNDMKWYIHDERLENKCNQYDSEDACEGNNGFPVPTYDPYEFLNTSSITRKQGLYDIEKDAMHGYEEIPIGCEWSPSITSTHNGTSITKQGSCNFRKEVNFHQDEPICKPLYCPEKYVPYSNRDGRGNNKPLPGPRQGKTKGECVRDTGDIIQGVDDARDCLCQQHLSCNTCTHDSNCQWCGSETPGASPGCYYVYTNDPICEATPIRQHAGGSCTSLDGEMKTGWSDLTISEQNVSNCENEFECINKETNQPIPQNIVQGQNMLTIDSIRTNYQINTQTNPPSGRDLCLSYNNHWLNTSSNTYTSNDDYCYFEKKIVDDPNYNSAFALVPMGLRSSDATEYNISIAPYYCRPKDTTNSTSQQNCPTHTSLTTCSTDNSCEWVPNELSDYKLFWNISEILSPNLHSDLIKIKSTDPNDPSKKCYLDTTSSPPTLTSEGNANANKIELSGSAGPSSLFYAVKDNNNNNIIKLKDTNKNYVTIHESAQQGCSIQYIDNLTSGKNNAFNLDQNLLNSIGGLHLDVEDSISCLDGYKYCDPSSSSSNCGANNPLFTHNLIDGKGPNGQICHLTTTSNCSGNIGCKRGSTYAPGDVIPLDQTADPTNNEFVSLSHKQIHDTRTSRSDGCNQTDNTFQAVNSPTNVDITNKYGSCNFYHRSTDYTMNKKKCNLINKKVNNTDIVHWGQYCVKNNTSVPVKNVCESLGSGYEWQDYESNGQWEGRCIFTDPTTIPATTIPIVMSNNDICLKIDDGGYTLEDSDNCIISVPNSIPSQAMVDICEKWDISDINPNIQNDHQFTYYQKPDNILDTYNVNRTGTCLNGIGRDRQDVSNMNRTTRENCEYDNNEYKQEYTYSDTSFCKLSDVNHVNDRKLTWTGGELQSDGVDNWSDECSSAVLSSCQVNCQPGYGGGGIYTCHYNTHSEDVCQHVEDTFSSITIEEIQRTNCENYPNCEYSPGTPLTDSTCTSLQGDDTLMKGQAEWLGNECYVLNNDAFSHGIYNLPTLNEAFPPLMRLISFFVILIFILFILRVIGFYKFTIKQTMKATKSLGEHTYKGIIAFILNLTGGIVDFVTLSAKLIKGDVKFYSFAAYKTIINVKKILYFLLFIGIIILINFYTNFLDFIRKGYNSEYVSIQEDIIQKIEGDEDEDNKDERNDIKEFIDRFFVIIVIAILTAVYYIYNYMSN